MRTIEELEILLCLARNRDRYCSASSIAAELGIPPSLVARGLEALASRSLLDVRIAEAVLYKLDPATDVIASALANTLRAAGGDRAAVLKAIRTGRSVVQDFADAFRLGRKRPTDG